MSYTTKPLSAITGRNGYCGPAAVSAIAGIDSDIAAAIMRRISGRRAIKGSYDREVTGALRVLGYGFRRSEVYNDKPPTLKQWASRREDRNQTCLVEVTGHWLVVRGYTLADSFHKQPVDIAEAKSQRCRVRAVWVVTQDVTRPDDAMLRDIERHRDDRKRAGAAMSRARRLAKKYGISIESKSDEFGPDSTGWSVWPPHGTDSHVDPFEGDHYVDEPEEVLERVQTYAEHMTA